MGRSKPSKPETPGERKRREEARELARLERQVEERKAMRKPDGFGVNESSLAMPANEGTEVKRDHRGKAKAVWRSNPFKLLLESGTLTHEAANAAHDLMTIYARSKGLAGGPGDLRIGIAGDPDGWGAEDRKQYNIRLYASIIDGLTIKSAKLAKAFAYAIVEEDRPMAWRGIVEREIQVTNAHRQSERMVVMCEELNERIPDCRKRLNDWIEAKNRAAA